MNEKDNYNFIFNWVLINKLALGNSPFKQENLDLLKKKGIKNIIGLCSESEIEWGLKTSDNFSCERIYIPDSKSNNLPSNEDLRKILNKLTKDLEKGATFIHCFASVERSPLICILFIMKKYNLEIEDALDYVLRKHKYTNPTNLQLRLIKNFLNDFD